MVCLPILKMGRSLLLNGKGILATGWSCVYCVFLLLPSCSSSCDNLPRWQVLGKILFFTCSAETRLNFSICTPNDVSAQSMLQYRDIPDLPSDGSVLPGLRTQGLSPLCPWNLLSTGSRDVAAWTELKGKRKKLGEGAGWDGETWRMERVENKGELEMHSKVTGHGVLGMAEQRDEGWERRGIGTGLAR